MASRTVKAAAVQLSPVLGSREGTIGKVVSAIAEAAAAGADQVIVTTDNPRSEDPAAIRAEVMAGAVGAAEIGDRAEAIRSGLEGLGTGDVLLVAGKGHETGQIVGDEVRPFDDRAQVADALAEAREGA